MPFRRHGLFYALVFAAAACSVFDRPGQARDGETGLKPATTVALVRHAERADDDPDDPVLTADGTARAARLARVFERSRIDAIIASDKKRTQLTVDPLRRARGLGLQVEPEAAGVVRAIRALPQGSLVVVAHHSHTMVDILRGLGVDGAEAETVRLDVYDNLLLITLHPEIRSRLVPLTYP